jgi:hypothetical protein
LQQGLNSPLEQGPLRPPLRLEWLRDNDEVQREVRKLLNADLGYGSAVDHFEKDEKRALLDIYVDMRRNNRRGRERQIISLPPPVVNRLSPRPITVVI